MMTSRVTSMDALGARPVLRMIRRLCGGTRPPHRPAPPAGPTGLPLLSSDDSLPSLPFRLVSLTSPLRRTSPGPAVARALPARNGSLSRPSLPNTVTQDTVLSPREAMDMALSLSRRSIGLSDPNPRVGCVITDPSGRLLGAGHTQEAGGPHAEVMALRDADRRGHGGQALVGAHVYVTLEPCAHHGRTPPCCEALSAAGVGHVHIALADPNPLVAGKGRAHLASHGIPSELGLGAEEAREINLGFLSRMVRGRPYVRMKIAASLDGRTALPDGRSQWITGPAAREDGHGWRQRAGAILTGIGTVLDDDPRLDLRLPGGGTPPRQPLRVIVDSQLRTPVGARILQPPGPVLLVHACETGDGFTVEAGCAPSPRWPAGVECMHLPDHSAPRGISTPASTSTSTSASASASPASANAVTHGEAASLSVATAAAPRAAATHPRVDLPALLVELGRRGVNELHVEAGATLNGAMLKAGLVDELLVYLAPTLLGEGRGMAALGLLPDLATAPRFELLESVPVGGDLRLRLRKPGLDF